MGASRLTTAVLISTLLVASACSSGDDDTADDDAAADDADESTEAPTAPADGDSADSDADAGNDMAPAAAAGEIPAGVDADFPVPFPEGWVIDTQEALAGMTMGAASVLYTTDDLDRIVAFYDDWTSDQADISRTDADDSVRYVRADPIMTITVVADFEYEGGTYTALQVSAASE